MAGMGDKIMSKKGHGRKGRGSQRARVQKGIKRMAQRG